MNLITPNLRTTFSGGDVGMWTISKQYCIIGDPLPDASKLNIKIASPEIENTLWSLSGISSNLRYAVETEVAALKAAQPMLGREEAISAVFIPIKKSQEWWDLAQDERRRIMEEKSRHISIGMDYLPAIARKLFHCKDLGESFDFLTWFEFNPENEIQFDDLLFKLRSSEEWTYVTRESELRLFK